MKQNGRQMQNHCKKTGKGHDFNQYQPNSFSTINAYYTFHYLHVAGKISLLKLVACTSVIVGCEIQKRTHAMPQCIILLLHLSGIKWLTLLLGQMHIGKPAQSFPALSFKAHTYILGQTCKIPKHNSWVFLRSACTAPTIWLGPDRFSACKMLLSV